MFKKPSKYALCNNLKSAQIGMLSRFRCCAVLRGSNGEFAPVLRAPLFVFPGVGFGDRIPPTSKPPSFPDKPRMPVDPLKRSGCPSPMRPFLLLASTLLCLMAGRLCADPLDHWTLAHSRTNHSPGRGAFGHGRFVISVGGTDGGRSGVWTSENGKEWRVTFEDALGSLRFSNGMFVGTASGGRVVSSVDGETWITRRLPLSGGGTQIASALGRFWTIAGESGALQLLSSSDALVWTISVPINGQLTYGDNGNLVIQGYNPAVQMVSTNGVDFVVAESMPLFSSMARIGNTWVGVESTNPQRNISVSTNGTDWVSLRPSPFIEGGEVFVAGERFVLIQPGAGAKPFFMESADGFKWTDHEVGLRLQLRHLVFGNDAMLSLALQQLDTPKPGVYTNVLRLHLSRPFTPTLPQPLEASLRPAVVLRSGIVGAGYSIESATKPEGPWIHATTVFPTNFPFSVMVPDGHGERGFFRSVLRDR